MKLLVAILAASLMLLVASTAGARPADPSSFCRGARTIQGPALSVPGFGDAALKCGKRRTDPRMPSPWVTWCGPGWGGYIPGFGQWCR